MKTLLLLAMALLPFLAYSQDSPRDLLIAAEITGEGKYIYPDSNTKGLFVKLTVTNNSVSNKKILIMSCSWMENWQTDNSNLILDFPGCDKNVPEHITLKPQKTIVFYGLLTRMINSKSDKNKTEYMSPRPPYDKWTVPEAGVRVRFGFSGRYPQNHFNDASYNDYSDKTWWSQPVSLQFDNNSFVVEE
ncbi:hypothetical protein MUN81_16815 [Hymenobacter sp. 5317J-9]|uniref:hypothetical protein n=1 Tax=Hymenobacter sp. 5317J-9 TaxID=2932250 RepID=UPI001FD7242D|nr:hypothetical protein [Hymenobacter sp. 5317J-9]UOQ96896.1 hypothetical protein MUN81_16815 [Hymenobacter sp. 5317J-9]